MQRDSVGLTNQNSELKFRLQSMEQQAKLRDGISVNLFNVSLFMDMSKTCNIVTHFMFLDEN